MLKSLSGLVSFLVIFYYLKALNADRTFLK